jgi:hypothetical protein
VPHFATDFPTLSLTIKEIKNSNRMPKISKIDGLPTAHLMPLKAILLGSIYVICSLLCQQTTLLKIERRLSLMLKYHPIHSIQKT